MSIVVYGKPDCPQCIKTQEDLTKHKLTYTWIDITLPENSKHLKKIRGLGFRSEPVIMEDGEPVALGYLLS